MTRSDARAATFTAGEAISSANLRVVLASDGDIEVASNTEHEIGTTRTLAASGDPVAVLLSTKEGSAQYVASNAIAVGAFVIPATGGKVADGTTTRPTGRSLGVAVTAATADGNIIEVIGPPDSGVGT